MDFRGEREEAVGPLRFGEVVEGGRGAEGEGQRTRGA